VVDYATGLKRGYQRFMERPSFTMRLYCCRISTLGINPKGLESHITLWILVPKGLSARTAYFVLRRDYFVSLHRPKMKTIFWWLVIFPCQNYVILIYLYLQHNLEKCQRNKRPKARRCIRWVMCIRSQHLYYIFLMLGYPFECFLSYAPLFESAAIFFRRVYKVLSMGA